MHKEEISIQKKYVLLINQEEGIIIDTGSPVSFHQSGKVSFGGKEFQCSKSILGMDQEALHEVFDLPIAGLIGMDILGQFDNLVFDYANHSILCDANLDEYDLLAMPSGAVMGIPYVDLKIADTNSRVFIDTGAPISYISDSYVMHSTAKDRLCDYHPIYGEFWTDIFDLQVEIEGETVTMQFGKLPAGLHVLLQLTGADAVIGYELLSRYTWVLQGSHSYVMKKRFKKCSERR